MFDWFNTVGFRADLSGLRAGRTPLTSLKEWVGGHWSTPAEPMPTA